MEKIKTLILEANGFGYKPILVDTIIRGVFKLDSINQFPHTLSRINLIKRMMKYHYDALSYTFDWRDSILEYDGLDLEICNINNLIELRKMAKRISEFDLIIILHSATGDSVSLLQFIKEPLKNRKGKLLVFIGNEYSLIPEKKKFLKETEADYISSQLPIDSAQKLYHDCNSIIIESPHALNPNLYFLDDRNKKVDIGFRGNYYPKYIGDSIRNNIIDYFRNNCDKYGLTCNISTGRNIQRDIWAEFLRDSRGIPGGEAGTDFLDSSGYFIESAKRVVLDKGVFDIDMIFKEVCRINGVTLTRNDLFSGKAVSSRHFEAIGTKTCQILIRGEYNGIFKPNEHYISVEKDLSNIETAIIMFKDETLRIKIVNSAYEYVMDQHTYDKRIKKIFNQINL